MADQQPSRSRRRVLSVLGAAAFAGCGLRRGNSEGDEDKDGSSREPPEGPTTPAEETETDDSEWALPTGSPLDVAVEPVPLVVNLEVPWDLAFTPTGELFVTERPGRLLYLDTDAVLTAADEPIDAAELAGASRQTWPGERILGVAIHPSYPNPPLVYVYYNVNDENRVGRFNTRATDPRETFTVLVDGIRGDHTIGGRIAFGPDDDLWITAGTAEEDPAQDPRGPNGTILRVTPDGDPSVANPKIDGGDPRVFTYGHRNPQGLTWLPDGMAACTDHGPVGRDEVAILWPGANYGWPDVHGMPDDPEYGSYADHDDVSPPVVHTSPDMTWAPAGCVFYTGDRIPAWRHRLFISTLRGQHLNIVTLLPPDADQPPLEGAARRYDAGWSDDTFTAISHRILEAELGRLRHVAQTPDGGILVLTSNRDGLAADDGPFPRDRDDALVQLRPL